MTTTKINKDRRSPNIMCSVYRKFHFTDRISILVSNNFTHLNQNRSRRENRRISLAYRCPISMEFPKFCGVNVRSRSCARMFTSWAIRISPCAASGFAVNCPHSKGNYEANIVMTGRQYIADLTTKLYN